MTMTALPVFKNENLLKTALTHRSALNEHKNESTESNERLEYLGDAVLELITTEFLYKTMPDTPEGKMTAIRSALVKTTTLSQVGKELDLGKMLFLSKGEEVSGGRENEALTANTVEAVIGALYLDQGLEVARGFIAEHILSRFNEVIDKKLYKDAKSSLQEEVQACGFEAPIYQVLGEEGPDHDKSFTVAVFVGGKQVGEGAGKSKQLAQQVAAAEALSQVDFADLAKSLI